MKNKKSSKNIGSLSIQIKPKEKRGKSCAVRACAFVVANNMHRRVMWYTYVVRNEKHPVKSWRGDSRLVSLAVASRLKPKH